MKRFLGFIIKETRHILRDRRTLVIMFGLPIAQIMIFGYAISNEIKQAEISILDNARDELSFRLTDKILSSGYFTLHKYMEGNQEIEDDFKTGHVKLTLVIGEKFSEQLEKEGRADIQILADASDPNIATTLTNYMLAIINDFQMELLEGNRPPFEVKPLVKMYYNPELKSVFLFVPGLLTIIMMLISAMMTSISITREKETGTMEVLMVSPLKPVQIILGKVLPYLLLSFTIANVVLLLGRFVFGVPIEGNLLLLEAMILLFIITALSLGILISTAVDRQQTAMMISMVGLMMPTILLSGFIFPVRNMPILLQLISNIIPAKWFVDIVRGIMLKGNGFTIIWVNALVMLGMSAFFIAVSVKKYKVRLQ